MPRPNRFHRHFVVAANSEFVLCLPLTRAFENERCHSATEKRRLVSITFLFGGIEPDRHHYDWRPFDPRRFSQDARERFTLVGNFDAFAGWSQVRQCGLPTFDLFLVCHFHLRLVLYEQERRKMIINAGALQAFPCSQEMLLSKRLSPKLLVVCSTRGPDSAPIVV